MALSLRDKLRAVDTPRKPAPAAAPVYHDCYHLWRSLPLEAVPHAWEIPMDMVRLMEPQTLPPHLSPEKILYLDTETTGLSGGAGTVAFLTGVGYLTPDGFQVHQYLMRDYPEERFLLENIRAILPQFDLLCTFNGKSFDLPLLFSRFRMNRMDVSALEKPHIDLLHLARRVWKLRLGRCNLGHLEEAIFGEPRLDDLPGSEVPERYFAYLKSGDFSLLEDILDHNRQDIASLCHLLTHMALMYQAPEKQRHEQDVFAMGVALEKNHHVEQARRCYRLAARGLTSASSHHRLAMSYRKAGDWQEAEKNWLEMLRRREGWITPYVELAKLYEHRLRDLPRALEITRAALCFLAEPCLRPPQTVQEAKNALQYRYARIQRKLDGQQARSNPNKDRRC